MKKLPQQNEQEIIDKINKNNETNAVFNGTAPEPVEYDPDTAYWNAMKINLKDKDLKKVLSGIKRLKNYIKKMKTFISALRTIVKIISRLEQILQAPWERIADEIKKRLKNILKQVGGTGVYILSTHEATSMGVSPVVIPDIIKDTDKPYTTAEFADNIYKYLGLDIFQDTDLTEQTQLEKKEFLNATGDPEATSDLLDLDNFRIPFTEKDGKQKSLNFGKHRAILYSECIEIIAESFIDEMDLPDDSLINGIKVKRRLAQEIQKAKEEQSKQQPSILQFVSKPDEGMFRPGRPYAEEGTVMQVMIIAFAVPNFSGFVSNMATMGLFFGGFMREISNKLQQSGEEFYNEASRTINNAVQMGTSLKDAEKNQKELDANKSLWGKVMWSLEEVWKAVINYGINTGEQEEDATNSDQIATRGTTATRAQMMSRAGSIATGGETPDFYGITLGSLFRPLFVQIEQLVSEVETNRTRSQTRWQQQINGYLSQVEKKINQLERVIGVIEVIVKQIQALLALNLSVLKVTSSGGNYDVYNKILNSKGFPSQEVQLPMYHFGLVVCSVMPTANSKGLNGLSPQALKKYFKDSQMEFSDEIDDLMQEGMEPMAAIQNVLQLKVDKSRGAGGGFGST